MFDITRINPTPGLTQEDMNAFKEIDDILGRAVAMGDPMIALEFGRRLKKGAALKSYALAKLMYRLQEAWNLFTASGTNDDFYTMVEDYIGNPPETTKKYVRMWQAVFENPRIPDDIKKLLLGKPIADTLLLTAGAADGSLDNEALQRAALAEDNGALKEIIRQKRGDVTSSGTAVRIYVIMRDRDSMTEGTIYAERGEEREVLGMLYPPKSELGQIAFDRITKDMKEIY